MTRPTKDGMTEAECWKILDEAGIDPDAAYDRLRKAIPDLPERTKSMRRPITKCVACGHEGCDGRCEGES